MKRGDIYFVNLDPTIGSEIRKKRPVLIISNNANNKAASTVTILPVTSNLNHIYPFEVLLEIKDSRLPKRSKVQCQQIRTISKLRIDKERVGYISENSIMIKISEASKLHLD